MFIHQLINVNKSIMFISFYYKFLFKKDSLPGLEINKNRNGRTKLRLISRLLPKTVKHWFYSFYIAF